MILLSFGIGFTQDVLTKPLVWPDYVKRGKLDNGLNYAIIEHQKPKDRMLAYILIQAGSLQETDSERGIAHYIEHMGFNGSKHFPPGELVKYFASIGTDMGPSINAYTSFDRTVYMVEVSTEKEEYIDKSLIALSDYAAGMLLTHEEVEKERGIILEELRLGSTLDRRIFEQDIAITLKGSLYPERLPIGLEETITKFTHEDLKKFYSNWYRPDLMTLVVVGDIKVPEIEKKIKDIFLEISAPEGNKPDLTVPFKPHSEIYTGVITDPELKETSLYISYLREPFSMKTEGDYRKSLSDRLIFEMFNMRLGQEKYKLNTPIISSAGFSSNYTKSLNKVTLWASARSGKSMEALKTLFSYSEGLRQNGFSNIEREEAQLQLLENLRKDKEEKETKHARYYINSILTSALRDDVFIGPDRSYELAQELLPTITDTELQERIEYLLEPLNMTVLVEAPQKEAAELKEEQVLSLVEDIIKQGGTAYKIEKLNYSYDYSNLKPGEVISRKDYKDLNVTELELANGLTVFLKPTDFQKDTIMVDYMSAGGRLLELPETPGMFEVAVKAWNNGGTEDLTQFEVKRLLKGKNIHFVMEGKVYYGITGNSTRGELEELFQWMWQYLERPGYREEGIAYGIRRAQEDIRRNLQYQEELMSDAESKLFLPNSPLSVVATEEEVEKYTDPESLKRFQKLSCNPVNSELIIVGAFNLEDGIKLVTKYFGSIPSGEKPSIPSNYLKAEFPKGNTKRIVYKGIEKRCLGTVIFPGCMKGEEDEIPLKVMAKVLDLRYWDKIREKESLVYSIWAGSSFPVSIKDYGKVKISFGCDPDKVDKVINASFAEIKDIKEKAPAEEELDSVKKILLLSYEDNLENNGFWLNNLLGTSLFNRDPAHILTDMEKIKNVKPEEIQAVARKYLQEKNNIIILGLPEEK